MFNNQDLNQVTWEQRAMGGDPKFAGSQSIPDFPYAEYAELAGLKGIYCDEPGKVTGRGGRPSPVTVRSCWSSWSTARSPRSLRTS